MPTWQDLGQVKLGCTGDDHPEEATQPALDMLQVKPSFDKGLLRLAVEMAAPIEGVPRDVGQVHEPGQGTCFGSHVLEKQQPSARFAKHPAELIKGTLLVNNAAQDQAGDDSVKIA